MEQAVQSCLVILQNPQQGFDKRLDTARTLQVTLRGSLATLNGQPRPANVPLLTWQDQRALERFLPALSQILNDRAPQIRAEIATLIGLLAATAPAHYNYSIRWISNNLGLANAAVDKKLLFIQIAQTFLLFAHQASAANSVGILANYLIDSLTSLASPDLFAATLNPLILVLQKYPHSYTLNFRDFVDVLIGWRLDPKISQSSRETIQSILRELGPLWRRDLEFSLGLIRQFLADIQKTGSDPTRPSDPVAFVELFSLVWKSLGFSSADTPIPLSSWMKADIQVGYIAVTAQFISVSRSAHEAQRQSSFVVPCLNALHVLQQVWGQAFSQFFPKTVELLSTLLNPFLPTRILSTFLDVAIGFIEAEAPRLLSGPVAKMMGPEWLGLRLHNDSEILAKLRKLYQTLFSASCAPLYLQGAVVAMIDELEKLKSRAVDLQSRKNPNEPLDLDQLKHLIAFDIAALSNLRQPPPNVIKYLIENFHPFSEPLIASNELLRLVSLSSILSLATVSSNLDMAPIQQILDLATASDQSHLSIVIALEYFNRMSSSSSSSAAASPIILERLLAMASQDDDNIRASSFRVLEILIKKQLSNPASSPLDPRIFSVALRRLEDSSALVVAEASKLLPYAPWPMPPSRGDGTLAFLHTSPTSHLTVEHFATYFNYLLGGNPRADLGKLQDLVKVAEEASEDKPKFQSLRLLMSSNAKALERWAAIEASKYLVTSRLKSQYGGANFTFENLLRIVSEAAKVQFSIDDLNDKDKWNRIGSMRTILEFIDQFDRQLYLAYEGSSSTLIPSISNPAILQFFRGNRRVCEDWFAIRLRAPALIVAQKAMSPYHVLRHGYQRLQFLNQIIVRKKEKSKTSRPIMIQERGGEDAQMVAEMNEVIRSLAQAHLWLNDIDGMAGLRSWALKHLPKGSVPLWIDPIVDHIKGRYEIALKKYEDIVSTRLQAAVKFDELLTLGQDRGFLFTRELQALAYLALGNLTAAQSFQTLSPRGSEWYGPDTDRLSQLGQLAGAKELAPLKPFPSSFSMLASLPGLAFMEVKRLLLVAPNEVDAIQSLKIRLLDHAYTEIDSPRVPILEILPFLTSDKEDSLSNFLLGTQVKVAAHPLVSELVASQALGSASVPGAASTIANLIDSTSQSKNFGVASRLRSLLPSKVLSTETNSRLNFSVAPSPETAKVFLGTSNTSVSSALSAVKLIKSHSVPIEALGDGATESILNAPIRNAVDFFRLSQYHTAIGSHSGLVVPALIGALKTPSTLDRSHLLRAALDLIKFICDSDTTILTPFSAEIATLSPSIWKDLLPQLMSRLDHPSQQVRGLFQQILLGVAQSHPEAVLYPVLSALKSKRSGFVAKLFASIKERNPDLIDQVQIMVEDFAAMTLLPQEQCVIALRHLQQEVTNVRIPSYLEEVKKVLPQVTVKDDSSFPPLASNTPESTMKQLSHRYLTVMSPAFIKLEKLTEQLAKSAAKSPFYSKFVAEATPQLNAALASFKTPRSYMKPMDAFAPVVAVLESMASYLKRNTMKLDAVAPRLSQLRPGLIPLPRSRGGEIFLQSINNEVQILQTKTKPRKILLHGTDGKSYSFMLKGREDLRLDERIMQFLRSVNVLLEKNSDAREASLHARSYVVIPLADRSALIEWVEGAQPVYNVYKTWQKRTAAAQKLLGQSPPADSKATLNKTASSSAPANDKEVKIQSPIDRFFAKIVPLLKSRGITNVSLRKEWPQDLIEQVWKELSREVPGHLLEQELWVTSPSASEWWWKQAHFARSHAVMSMIGFVLGLGDRHLDNILIDFERGEVIHIDYNICFDRGLLLRVPETVPFRLTQLFKHALGPAGTREGPFTNASRTALKVLRKGRSTLLTLLETFVYEPLIDWGGESGAKAEELRLEVQVLIQLLETRAKDLDTLASNPNFSVYPAAIAKLSVALNMHEKRAYLAQCREELIKDLSHLQSEKKQIDASEKALNQELAGLPQLFSLVTTSVNHASAIYNAELNALAQFQTSLPSLQNLISVDSNSLVAVPDPLRPLEASLPATIGSAILIPGLPLQEGLVTQCSSTEVSFKITLHNQLRIAHNLIQTLLDYRSISTQSPSPVEYLKFSVSSNWRESLMQIEDEIKKTKGVVPAEPDFGLLEMIRDAVPKLRWEREERADQAQPILADTQDKILKVTAQTRELDLVLSSTSARLTSAQASLATGFGTVSAVATTQPQGILAALGTLLETIGSKDPSLTGLLSDLAKVKLASSVLYLPPLLDDIRFNSNSFEDLTPSQAALALLSNIESMAASISLFSDSLATLVRPLLQSGIDLTEAVTSLGATPPTASAFSDLMAAFSASCTCIDAGMRSLAFADGFFGILQAHLPVPIQETSFLTAKITFLCDLFDKKPEDEVLAALTSSYINLIRSSRLNPVISELKAVLAKVPSQHRTPEPTSTSALEALVPLHVELLSIYSERASDLQKRSHFAEEALLLSKQLAAQSMNDCPFIPTIETESGPVTSPYILLLGRIRSMIDTLETERKNGKAAIDTYATLETQVVVIVDWFAQRNRDRTLQQSFQDAVNRRKASVSAISSHLQQLLDLAKSILTLEADRSVTPLLLAPDSNLEPSLAQLKTLLGSFSAPSSNLEMEANKILATIGNTLESLHTAKMSISKLRFAIKEKQQVYEEKRLSVKRLSDELQAMESAMDPKARSAANNPRQLPEYFKIAELLKTPLVSTLETDLLPLLASILKLASNSEATTSIGKKAATILGSFKNWLKLLKHFVDISPQADPNLSVEGLLGEIEISEAGGWLSIILSDLKDLSSEQLDLSQSDHSLSSRIEGDFDESETLTLKEGDRKEVVDKKFAERAQLAREMLLGVDRKLAGLGSDGSGSVVPVEDQVERLVNEATNPTNLSRMYEGWTSWI